MSPSIWLAPAKLNLFIHVTGRRADGYHTLQTIFQFLDYCDELHITATAGSQLTLTCDTAIGADEGNLCLQAARLLQQRAGITQGAQIRLEKRIPIGAGLGGGSSDAASTLVALNQLWALNWPAAKLATLGAQLGADIPVFVQGQAAWAEGIGDELTPLPDLPEPWFAVIKPPISVPTAEIYQAPELTRDAPPRTIAGFLAGETGNSFEPVVIKRYPPIAEALDWLNKRVSGPDSGDGRARLTGTGACVFATFETQAEAEQGLEGLPASWFGFAAQGRNRSPLYAR